MWGVIMKIDNSISNELILDQIGQQIVNQRKGNGITQAGLAEKAGVSKRTIERLEAGKSIQMINYIKLLRVFGLTGKLNLPRSPKTTTHIAPVVKTKQPAPVEPPQHEERIKKSRSWGIDG